MPLSLRMLENNDIVKKRRNVLTQNELGLSAIYLCLPYTQLQEE